MLLDDDAVPLDRRIKGKRGALIVVYNNLNFRKHAGKDSVDPAYVSNQKQSGQSARLAKIKLQPCEQSSVPR
jgi:hypothetical protein